MVTYIYGSNNKKKINTVWLRRHHQWIRTAEAGTQKIGKVCETWKSALKDWNKSNWPPQEVLQTKARRFWQPCLITSTLLSRNLESASFICPEYLDVKCFTKGYFFQYESAMVLNLLWCL